MAGALKQARAVVEGLEVDAAAMRRNIDLTGGLVMSEAVMMGLGPYIGREYAHDLVYDLCRDAVAQRPPAARPARRERRRSASTSTATRWRSCCDPANYLGQAGVMVDRVLDRLADAPAPPRPAAERPAGSAVRTDARRRWCMR